MKVNRIIGNDPTDGARNFNFRDADQLTNGVIAVQTNTFHGMNPVETHGPFNNSFPTKELGSDNIYANIYR